MRIVTRSAVASVERGEENRLASATVRHLDTGAAFTVQPKIVIDATELGDIMPLAGIPYTSGMESFAETGEPSAPAVGNWEAVQGFTYAFAVEYRPGENHVIPKPEGYEENKNTTVTAGTPCSRRTTSSAGRFGSTGGPSTPAISPTKPIRMTSRSSTGPPRLYRRQHHRRASGKG